MIERSHFKTEAEYKRYLEGRKKGRKDAKLFLKSLNIKKQASK